MGFFACGLNAEADSRPVVDWEEPRCLLCNSQGGSVLVEAPDPLPGKSGLWFAVTQCQDCGLCYTSPRPTSDSMAQFYPSNYPPHLKPVKMAKRAGWQWSLSWRRRHKHVERLPLQGRGRLLDFGCGSGAFLVRMRQRGWVVTGLDFSEQAVQSIRTNLGLCALVGTLPHPELGDSTFDVVTMRHSLEHVHQPLDVLRSAYRLLVPGGQLVVSVPNIDSLPFKWFGRSWRGLDLPRHLTHFTADTLQLMLARAGFEVGSVRMVRQPQWIRHSAQLASQQAYTGYLQGWLKMRLLASAASWCAYLVGRSDAMVVTAVKAAPVELSKVSSFRQDLSRHSRYSADRWRNR